MGLPSFVRCLENWEGLKSITVRAKSSQRPVNNTNHLSLHNQQLRECPSFWLDGHLPPSGNHTILLLQWIPHFNLPNSVIHDQVPFPDVLSSSWKEFSPSLIALNPLSSAFHRRKLKARAKVETTTTWSFLFEKPNLDGLTRAPVLSVLLTKS